MIAWPSADKVNGSKKHAFTPVSIPPFTLILRKSVECKIKFGVSALTAWRLGRRNWVGAGAGATPVFVAMTRHETSLARLVSLVGLSRPAPPIQERIAMRSAFPIFITSKEQT